MLLMKPRTTKICIDRLPGRTLLLLGDFCKLGIGRSGLRDVFFTFGKTMQMDLGSMPANTFNIRSRGIVLRYGASVDSHTGSSPHSTVL